MRSQAVLVAIGINREGRRKFLVGIKQRGLRGVQLVVSDDHEGVKNAIREILSEAAWQRCYVHFLRNALDHLPRKANDDCLVELRWLYDRHESSRRARTWASGCTSGKRSTRSYAIGWK